MNKFDFLQMRAEMRLHVQLLRPNLMITHNFGGLFTPGTAPSKLAAFYNGIQRQAYGRNWASQYGREWPTAYGFLEHIASNPHYHVLARVAPSLVPVIKEQGQQIWVKKVPRGQLHVEAITPGIVGPIIYCTKDLRGAAAFDGMFVYCDTRTMKAA